MRRYAVIIIALLLLPLCSEGQQIAYKKATRQHGQSPLLIANYGEKPVDIAFLLSDYFFLTDAILIDYINKTTVPDSLNRDYRKAWVFMLEYTWSARVPLAKRNQMINGLQFFNSLGWGFCGVKSQMLAWIWKKMGYESRVWDLKGHIVPEIFVDGHWEVWDPTYHVFYPDHHGVPTGVDSLSVYPEMIYHPNDPFGIKKNYWMKMMGYGEKLAQMYATVSDNSLLGMEVSSENATNSQNFTLPAHSKLLFPVYSRLPLWSDFQKEPQRLYDYAECAVYIDAGYTGIVQLPLALHAISSVNARVALSGNQIEFNSKQSRYIQVGLLGGAGIEILENKTGIWLYYLVNPQLVKRKPGIECIQSGQTVEGIQVEPISLSPGNRVNVVLLTDVQPVFHLEKFRKSFFRWLSAKN